MATARARVVRISALPFASGRRPRRSCEARHGAPFRGFIVVGRCSASPLKSQLCALSINHVVLYRDKKARKERHENTANGRHKKEEGCGLARKRSGASFGESRPTTRFPSCLVSLTAPAVSLSVFCCSRPLTLSIVMVTVETEPSSRSVLASCLPSCFPHLRETSSHHCRAQHTFRHTHSTTTHLSHYTLTLTHSHARPAHMSRRQQVFLSLVFLLDAEPRHSAV